jgi:DNA-binding PadR family transcriptional regulator
MYISDRYIDVSMLDLAILGFLKEEPRHGYELKRRLGDLGLRSVSFGSLYPALRRLDRSHLIESIDGRNRKKVYQITPAGEAKLKELLEDRTTESEDDRSFNLRVAFFRYLDPEVRLQILERRKMILSDRVDRDMLRLRRARERIDRYTFSLIEREAHQTAVDIDWIDELIATEQAAIRRRKPATRWHKHPTE